jgi:hypothetical protein
MSDQQWGMRGREMTNDEIRMTNDDDGSAVRFGSSFSRYSSFVIRHS